MPSQNETLEELIKRIATMGLVQASDLFDVLLTEIGPTLRTKHADPTLRVGSIAAALGKSAISRSQLAVLVAVAVNRILDREELDEGLK